MSGRVGYKYLPGSLLQRQAVVIWRIKISYCIDSMEFVQSTWMINFFLMFCQRFALNEHSQNNWKKKMKSRYHSRPTT